MIPNLQDITWLSLTNPLMLSVVIVLFMQLIGVPAIDAIRRAIFKDRPNIQAPAQDLLTNLVALVVACGIAALHVSETFMWGQAFLTGFLATAMATLEYEATKNAVQALGLKWW